MFTDTAPDQYTLCHLPGTDLRCGMRLYRLLPPQYSGTWHLAGISRKYVWCGAGRHFVPLQRPEMDSLSWRSLRHSADRRHTVLSGSIPDTGQYLCKAVHLRDAFSCQHRRWRSHRCHSLRDDGRNRIADTAEVSVGGESWKHSHIQHRWMLQERAS